MKKIEMIIALLLMPCVAIGADWLDGNVQFKPKANRPSALSISWLTVPNVQATCEAESKRRGLGGFGYGVDACSFWTTSQCTIVTSTKPTMTQLGHEARHCFEKNFHP